MKANGNTGRNAQRKPESDAWFDAWFRFGRRRTLRHFHGQRFGFTLLSGLTGLIVLTVTGLADPFERSLLDLRLRLRPNVIHADVPVRVALLSSRDGMDDQTFHSGSAALLQALSSPDLPEAHRPRTLAFGTPLLRILPENPLARALTTHAAPTASGARRPGVVQAFLFSPEGQGLAAESVLKARGWPLPVGAAGLRRAEGVFLPSLSPETLSPKALWAASEGLGYVNLVENENRLESVRSVPVILRFRGQVYPSLGLAAAMHWLGVTLQDVTLEPGNAITLRPPGRAELRIPIDERGDLLLNFRSTLGHVKGSSWAAPVDFATPMERIVSSLPPEGMLEALKPGGKLLFVGDPRMRVSSPMGSTIPVVQVHAQLASDILSGDFLRPVPAWLDFLLGVLAVGVLALYLGARDPQGLGAVWVGLATGVTHGSICILAFGLGPWWMKLSNVGLVMFGTVLTDGLFLHSYLKRSLQRVRAELDQLEHKEGAWLESLSREEQEQAERLEQLQRAETLASTILKRQEALVARALPERPVSLEVETGEKETGGAGGRDPGANLTQPEKRGGSAPPNEPQPLVLREVSRRYRSQVRRMEELLTRYRQLLDQVLRELEQARAREPVSWTQDVEQAVAEELVALTGVVTRDPAMLHTLHQIVTRVGPNDRATVLIHGESGTGKELIARAIYRTSPRKSGPFVPINCGAIPEGLIESELFGHVKGAFSGAARDRRGAFLSAQGGVLFLDEIGDAPPHIQVKLLRALQERRIRPVGADADIPIDVRIVAATHRDLKASVKKGEFREDLYHRLHVIPIELPALRDRKGDIVLLSRLFLSREESREVSREVSGEVSREALRELSQEDKRSGPQSEPTRVLSEGALARLKMYAWPGNVRELENTLVALNATCAEGIISEEAVAHLLGQTGAVATGQTGGASGRGMRVAGFGEPDLRWLTVLRRHHFSIVHAVAEPDAPAHNRQTGYRRLVGLSCKALYLSDWNREAAAALLAGEQKEAMPKALAKLQTYLHMIELTLAEKDLQRFQSEWRRFLGDDYFYVNATLEAVRAGHVDSRTSRELPEDP